MDIDRHTDTLDRYRQTHRDIPHIYRGNTTANQTDSLLPRFSPWQRGDNNISNNNNKKRLIKTPFITKCKVKILCLFIYIFPSFFPPVLTLFVLKKE